MSNCPTYWKKDVDITETPCCNASTNILLVAKENPFYRDKTISVIKQPHMIFSSDSCSCPAIKDICVDEGVQSCEKILIEYDNVDENVSSTANFCRMCLSTVFREEMTNTASSHDHKDSLSSEDLPGFRGKNMEKDHEKRVSVTEIWLKPESQRTLNLANDNTHPDDLKSLFVKADLDSDDITERCSFGKLISEEGNLEATDLPVENSSKKQNHSFEEFGSISTPVDPILNEGSDWKQHFRQNLNQSAKEGNSTSMVASSPGKLEGGWQSERTSDRIDLFVKNDLQLSVSSTDHGSQENDLSKPFSDNGILYHGGSSSDVGTEKPSTSGFVESTKEINEQEIVPEQNGVKTKKQGVNGAAPVPSLFAYHSNGESEFSGSVLSGPFVNSGHIAYSGSISLRSESSTTSAHSFAFPILQTEWNDSPVRMAKADRKKGRHQRYWKAFVCCKS